MFLVVLFDSSGEIVEWEREVTREHANAKANVMAWDAHDEGRPGMVVIHDEVETIETARPANATRPVFCTICRRHHGLEVLHASE